MADKIFDLILLSMCVSTISLTITKSKAFSSLRRVANEHNKWLGALLSCSYCMSHWGAAFFVGLLYCYSPMEMMTNNLFIDVTITIFATVSLATIVSGIMYFVMKTM